MQNETSLTLAAGKTLPFANESPGFFNEK